MYTVVRPWFSPANDWDIFKEVYPICIRWLRFRSQQHLADCRAGQEQPLADCRAGQEKHLAD